MNNPKFEWIEEVGTAFCVLTDKKTKKEYVGYAYCHPDDDDMKSEKTGCEIALRRATIEVYKDMRDTLLTELAALNQLYYSMNKSKQFHPRGYEAKMLYRQIRIREEDLALARELIKTEQEELKKYLEQKENLFQGVRDRRSAKANLN